MTGNRRSENRRDPYLPLPATCHSRSPKEATYLARGFFGRVAMAKTALGGRRPAMASPVLRKVNIFTI